MHSDNAEDLTLLINLHAKNKGPQPEKGGKKYWLLQEFRGNRIHAFRRNHLHIKPQASKICNCTYLGSNISFTVRTRIGKA